MKFLGPHVSAAGGVEQAPVNAAAIGATAFGLFTRNQRQWASKPLSGESIDAFKRNMDELGYSAAQVLPHDSYLINVGSADPEISRKSFDALLDELTRVEQLGLTFLNFHPGAHVNLITEEECLERISQAMNLIFGRTEHASLVIEGTAGQGSNVGYRFEHLAAIIGMVEQKERVGVCLDTCHMFAAGYDLRTPAAYEKTMAEFEKVVGFRNLKGIHLNDAKVELGSKKDRHHSIGRGTLGFEAFRLIMNDERLEGIPLILETIDETVWEQEIQLLQSLVGKKRVPSGLAPPEPKAG